VKRACSAVSLVVASLAAAASEQSGQYLQVGFPLETSPYFQIDLLTVERCNAALRLLRTNPETATAFAPEEIRCSSVSFSTQLPFHGAIRQMKSGNVYRVDALDYELCLEALKHVPVEAQPPKLEVIIQCAGK
jgi:hypothetical protein